MTNGFKQRAAEQRGNTPRSAIPQVNPATPKVIEAPSSPAPQPVDTQPATAATNVPERTEEGRPIYLTPVNTEDARVNRGFHMYDSRHRQVTQDLAYIEQRKPWEIIEDALEEYVVKHYGKQYRRQGK